MRRFRTADDGPEINMAPMLDIIFILLIFFVVTAAFVQEAGLELNQSPPSLDPPEESSAVLITISAAGLLCIDGHATDPRMVRPRIEALHAARPEAPVVVLPHADSSAGLLVQIYDDILLAGATAMIGEGAPRAC